MRMGLFGLIIALFVMNSCYTCPTCKETIRVERVVDKCMTSPPAFVGVDNWPTEPDPADGTYHVSLETTKQLYTLLDQISTYLQDQWQKCLPESEQEKQKKIIRDKAFRYEQLRRKQQLERHSNGKV